MKINRLLLFVSIFVIFNLNIMAETIIEINEPNELPNLWILSIGVNRYNSLQISNNNYSINDAREIINIFKLQEGRVYNRVNSLLIADDSHIKPTRENIIDNLSFLQQAAINDIAILFIAGQSMIDKNGFYYFLPSNASLNTNGTIRVSSAVSWADFEFALNFPSKKFLLIDTDNTDRIFSNKIRREYDDPNARTAIFTATRNGQHSMERSDLKHGVFTYAMLQGLNGEAADENKNITVTSLYSYIEKKMRELTNNTQEPDIRSHMDMTGLIMARNR